MFKKGQGGMNVIILVIAIIIGVAAGITIFIDLGVTQQTITTIDNEQITNTDFNHSFTLANPKIVINTLVILNSTGNSGSSRNATLTATDAIGEYRVDNLRLGTITVINRTGTWNVSYNYKPTAYAESGTTRTILGLLPIFLAIGLIILVGRNMILQGG